MKVYSMNVRAINPNDEKWYKLLSDKRTEKVNRLKQAQKKAQSIGVELLLIRAVRDITGKVQNVNWDTDDKGKLYLTQYPQIHVNLSHSGDWAVCAAGDTPVGVDIQYMREYDEGLITRFFTRDEAEYIARSSDKSSAFYRIWTRKESFLKATGKGITVPLNSISVLKNEIYYEGVNYRFREYRVRDKAYKLSVCFASSPL